MDKLQKQQRPQRLVAFYLATRLFDGEEATVENELSTVAKESCVEVSWPIAAHEHRSILARRLPFHELGPTCLPRQRLGKRHTGL